MRAHLITLPHARLYARRGHPIRRVGWTAQWLILLSGSIWLRITASGSAIVPAGDLTADFLAADWTIWGSADLAEDAPARCDPPTIDAPPPFRVRPNNLDSSGPPFDLTRPPCAGVRLALT